ncbi:hypothetical protein Patl1_21119 [Pistacia atlantica]|uniref:Uncharacterized protein n=1 Tax=Pistacia atlantica TaxID=434234 RepID=A0ACC1BNJ0_9ROSI|nr:hypothetical protein Patl1_21119 [Pistacia atlantica]
MEITVAAQGMYSSSECWSVGSELKVKLPYNVSNRENTYYDQGKATDGSTGKSSYTAWRQDSMVART